MTTASYTIRYRSALHRDSVRLIVEDPAGTPHLFTCHPDHCSLTPLGDEALHEAALVPLGWHPVPPADPYSLDALRSLLTGALLTHHLPPSLARAATGER